VLSLNWKWNGLLIVGSKWKRKGTHCSYNTSMLLKRGLGSRPRIYSQRLQKKMRHFNCFLENEQWSYWLHFNSSGTWRAQNHHIHTWDKPTSLSFSTCEESTSLQMNTVRFYNKQHISGTLALSPRIITDHSLVQNQRQSLLCVGCGGRRLGSTVGWWNLNWGERACGNNWRGMSGKHMGCFSKCRRVGVCVQIRVCEMEHVLCLYII
jgi:hypothetical protein